MKLLSLKCGPSSINAAKSHDVYSDGFDVADGVDPVVWRSGVDGAASGQKDSSRWAESMKAFGVDTEGGVDEVVVVVDVENASPRASSVLRGTREFSAPCRIRRLFIV